MISIGGSASGARAVGRRPFLRVGGAGLAGLAAGLGEFSLLLGSVGGGRVRAAEPAGPLAACLRDRSVIFLFMHGGPSQYETFDPKTTGPSNVHSQTGVVRTAIPGVVFGSTFHRLAARADRFNVVRSFTTGDGNHDIKPVVGAATKRANLGSLYARVAGATRPATAMPTNLVLHPQAVRAEAGPPIADFGNFASSGDMGPAFAPVVPGAGGGFQDDMTLRLAPARLGERRALLDEIDRGRRWRDAQAVRGASAIHDSAFDALLRGVSDAFDLSREDPATLAAYDTAALVRPESIDRKWNNWKHYTDHGQSIGKLLLLARRLCERGAGFVTVTTSFVWDMHADINNAHMTEGMRYVGEPFDHAVAAFIDDVEARGLSDKILLVCCGEMGRTPALNAAGGRDHWGGLAPLVLYGGGLGRGIVHGRSTADGGQPAGDPVTIPDLLATILDALLDVTQVRLLDGLPRSLQATLGEGRPIRLGV
ncbi:MAG: DUF1501 domain-containing protein [Planctomycetaceae bacterium]